MSELRTQSFILTSADRLWFYIRTYYGSLLAPLRALYLSVLILAAPAALFYHAWRSETSVQPAIWTLLAMLSIWLALLPALGVFQIWSSNRKQTSRPCVVILTNDYVAYEGPESHYKVVWANIAKVQEFRSHLAIYVQLSVAWLVPKSAFDSPDDARTFAAFARRCQAANSDTRVQTFSGAFPTHVNVADSLISPDFPLRFHHFLIIYLIGYYASFRRLTTILVVIAVAVGLPWWLNRELADLGQWAAFWPRFARISVTILAGVFGIMPPLLATRGWFGIRNRAATIIGRRVTITSDGVACDGETFEGGIAWRQIRAVTRPFGVMLFWTGACSAIPLPDSAFESRVSADAFYRQARDYWQAAAKTTLDGKG